MRLETDYVAMPTSSARLHCVWVASEDESGVHLTARWIGTERREARLPADPRLRERGGEPCWHITLYFVWDSH